GARAITPSRLHNMAITEKPVRAQEQAAAATADMPPAGMEQWTSDTRFFGHPRGLATLFFTEMWERFSYYGIRPLLVLFMSLGLVLIVCGTGLLKPNISAIVGDLYPEGGARRDAGFSIYYMGINVGAFTGQLVTGFLGEKVGWGFGFGAAGVGMIAGLITYAI